MVKNLPSSTEDVGLIPGQGTKILHSVGRLSPHLCLLSPHTLEPGLHKRSLPTIIEKRPHAQLRPSTVKHIINKKSIFLKKHI